MSTTSVEMLLLLLLLLLLPVPLLVLVLLVLPSRLMPPTCCSMLLSLLPHREENTVGMCTEGPTPTRLIGATPAEWATVAVATGAGMALRASGGAAERGRAAAAASAEKRLPLSLPSPASLKSTLKEWFKAWWDWAPWTLASLPMPKPRVLLTAEDGKENGADTALAGAAAAVAAAVKSSGGGGRKGAVALALVSCGGGGAASAAAAAAAAAAAPILTRPTEVGGLEAAPTS